MSQITRYDSIMKMYLPIAHVCIDCGIGEYVWHKKFIIIPECDEPDLMEHIFKKRIETLRS